ncbi:MAG: iron-containing alcohol dehydrogenase [Thiobacillus sp.]|nr:iron-containing alcohol dehydrogenase [Thiobacillus sp.]
MPTRIIFGSGAQSLFEKELDAQAASSVLLVSGRASARQNGSYRAITALLEARGTRYVEYAGCKENPDDAFVGEGARFAQAHGVDFILAIGGGSVIDAAKAIALLAANRHHDIWTYRQDRTRFDTPALPLGVVLTTTGTGTEVNGGFVITRTGDNEKVAFSSLSARPRFAYCNPDFTITLPPQVLADNYTDILSHLLEQYFSMEETTGIVDAMILEAIHYLLKHTPGLKNWKDSYSLRANTMFASTISLSYLFSCGKKVPWILHCLVHALSAHRPVSHGAALRIVMPGWLVWLSGKPSYATRIQHLVDKLALSEASQLGRFFVDHFAMMGCDVRPVPSPSEKDSIMASLVADTEFLARAELGEHDLRCILDWEHGCSTIDPDRSPPNS